MTNHAFLRVFLLFLLLALPCVAQNKLAKLDDKGNVFVSSDEGKLIWMADARHCSETIIATDGQTVGCVVATSTDVFPPAPSHKLEIYLKGGRKQTLELATPIVDWHFWREGREVAVHSGENSRQETYALYDSASGRLLDRLPEPPDVRTLPLWAKSHAQLQDEAVPMSAAMTQERTQWVAKVLRQIEKIEPGMQRKNLSGIFRTEGGMSNRFQRTYVHVECPYIKVNVRFKAATDTANALKEDPNDTIESISQPFLQFSVAD